VPAGGVGPGGGGGGVAVAVESGGVVELVDLIAKGGLQV
jgi:hypothetical protein